MSRTDAHRPPSVWLADHPELVREHHDHTGGPCTLPTGAALSAQTWAPGRCYVDLEPLVRTCGCNLCTGKLARGWSNSRRRAAERALLRAAAYVDEEDLEALEGVVLVRSKFVW